MILGALSVQSFEYESIIPHNCLEDITLVVCLCSRKIFGDSEVFFV